MLKYHFVQDELPYTGAELSNHWIYKNFGILGDAIVAFVGPCKVELTSMVDLEDVLNNDFIYSKQMLHFIIEIFGTPLREGVCVQRLFSALLQDKLNMVFGDGTIKRRGDDLFYQETQKLSVSICTVSPTSILVHTGLNIDAAGAPVEASGLSSELGMTSLKEVEQFATSCMRALSEELEDIALSCCKVRAVF